MYPAAKINMIFYSFHTSYHDHFFETCEFKEGYASYWQYIIRRGALRTAESRAGSSHLSYESSHTYALFLCIVILCHWHYNSRPNWYTLSQIFELIYSYWLQRINYKNKLSVMIDNWWVQFVFTEKMFNNKCEDHLWWDFCENYDYNNYYCLNYAFLCYIFSCENYTKYLLFKEQHIVENCLRCLTNSIANMYSGIHSSDVSDSENYWEY